MQTKLEIDLSHLDLTDDQLGRMAYLFGANLGTMSHGQAIRWLNRIIEVARLLGRRELDLLEGSDPL